MTTLRPAVFLDRDGTVNVDTDFVRDAATVALIPGAAEAIARLNAARWPVIVISNQSGIGRGIFTHDEYEQVRRRIDELLAERGAHVEATYICPHVPPQSPADVACECRKPGTALYRQAAAEHAIDVARSWFIGDRWRDVAPAVALGGRGILVPSPRTPQDDVERARAELQVADTLGEAVARVIG